MDLSNQRKFFLKSGSRRTRKLLNEANMKVLMKNIIFKVVTEINSLKKINKFLITFHLLVADHLARFFRWLAFKSFSLSFIFTNYHFFAIMSAIFTHKKITQKHLHRIFLYHSIKYIFTLLIAALSSSRSSLFSTFSVW